MGSPVLAVRTATQHYNMVSKLAFSAAALLLLCLVETGSGIKCHQCNSYTEAECVDPFFHPDTPDKPKTDKFLMECPNNGKEHFCRKIYQNVRDDVRVIRSCGWERDEKGRDCYTTVLEEYNTVVCQCDADGCNSANTYKLSLVSAMCAVVLAYLIH